MNEKYLIDYMLKMKDYLASNKKDNHI